MMNSVPERESSVEAVQSRLIAIFRRNAPPEPQQYIELLEKASFVLLNEDEAMRPRDESGLPGGIVYLKRDISTVIVPDIHARIDFLISVLFWEFEESKSILCGLREGAVQLVCVGDGFHAEGRAVERWKRALDEYEQGYKERQAMDGEMRESLGVMEMVMELKVAFPAHFHFLKGNHENITNELGGGNFPFRKFASEGAMVVDYVKRFYGRKFIESFYSFEKNLPLLAVGANFLISHAEPAEFYSRDDVIDYRNRPDVVEGLTWTANDAADEGSVQQMIAGYLGSKKQDSCYYFGGHRPTRKRYNLRAGGRYVQIHNPEKFIVAEIGANGNIDLERDIVEIVECAERLITDPE